MDGKNWEEIKNYIVRLDVEAYDDDELEELDRLIEELRSAGEAGDIEAEYQLACYYEERGRELKAYGIFCRLAEKGEIRSMADVGWAYYKGSPLPKDEEKGEAMLRTAAATGNAYAQFVLGLVLIDGKESIETMGRVREGWEYIRKAASKKFAPAVEKYQTVPDAYRYTSQPQVETTSQNTQKSGCYIATCVYGSYDCPEVWTLRRYRDNTLAETYLGRSFIRLYYAVSPSLVEKFGKTEWFQKFWRKFLNRMVERLQASGVEDTPYQDKKW